MSYEAMFSFDNLVLCEQGQWLKQILRAGPGLKNDSDNGLDFLGQQWGLKMTLGKKD